MAFFVAGDDGVGVGGSVGEAEDAPTLGLTSAVLVVVGGIGGDIVGEAEDAPSLGLTAAVRIVVGGVGGD